MEDCKHEHLTIEIVELVEQDYRRGPSIKNPWGPIRYRVRSLKTVWCRDCLRDVTEELGDTIQLQKITTEGGVNEN